MRAHGRPVRPRGVPASGQLPAGTRAGDVLRGHRLHVAGFARCHGRLRRHRAATAPPARHARCDRGDRKASSTRAAHERRSRRRDRRIDRNGRGSCTLGHGRADTRARARLSPRPAQPALGTVRHDCRRRGLLCDRRRLVAGASGRPRPHHARPLGATAETEARAPLGNRRRRVDRGGSRQPRAVRPRQALLIVAGILATILGTLLLGPLAIRLFARAAGHAPIAVRLALRDLARYQARSGAALAAITLALGIAAAVVIIAAAEEKKAAGDRPTCPTGRSVCTPVRCEIRGRSRSRRPRSSTGWRLAFATRGRSRPCDRHSAPERLATRREGSRLRGRPRPCLPVATQTASRTLSKHPDSGYPLRRHASLCSDTSVSTPRRSTRARTSWPTRASRPTSSSFPSSSRQGGEKTRGAARHERPENRQPGSTSAGRTETACRPRSSRSTVFAATA